MQDLYSGMISDSGSAEIIIYAVMAISAVAMLIYYLRSEKPVRTAVFGMISGAAALLLVNHFGGGMIPCVPLNGFTAFIALTLGIPGVAALIALLML